MEKVVYYCQISYPDHYTYRYLKVYFKFTKDFVASPYASIHYKLLEDRDPLVFGFPCAVFQIRNNEIYMEYEKQIQNELKEYLDSQKNFVLHTILTKRELEVSKSITDLEKSLEDYRIELEKIRQYLP